MTCYYLKLLHVPKTDIKAFIREFEHITEEYKATVNSNVASMVVHPDLSPRLGVLKNFI